MMDARQAIIESKIRLVSKRLDDSIEVTPKTPLLRQQLLDSVELMELIAALEQEFSVAIPLEELTPRNFASINRIAGLVERIEAADG
ncbi:MAG: acyl carrier protein [Parasphingopyxis sp.]|nr:phosphopantetheine-binding protein [Sphingomonadales bacterium]